MVAINNQSPKLLDGCWEILDKFSSGERVKIYERNTKEQE